MRGRVGQQLCSWSRLTTRVPRLPPAHNKRAQVCEAAAILVIPQRPGQIGRDKGRRMGVHTEKPPLPNFETGPLHLASGSAVQSSSCIIYKYAYLYLCSKRNSLGLEMNISSHRSDRR